MKTLILNTVGRSSLTLLVAFGLLLFFVASGCTPKEGCPSMNQHTKVGKNGELPTSHGRSGLFPKGMR